MKHKFSTPCKENKFSTLSAKENASSAPYLTKEEFGALAAKFWIVRHCLCYFPLIILAYFCILSSLIFLTSDEKIDYSE